MDVDAPTASAGHSTPAMRDEPVVGGGPGGPGSRRRVLFTGTAAVAGLVGVALLVSSLRSQAPGASPSAPAPSHETAACGASDVDGRILRWEGATGSRIATTVLSTTATAPCTLGPYRLVLVDGAGRGLALIVGADVQRAVTLGPGQQATTLVRVSNYCLAAIPQEPVTIRLDGVNESLLLRPAADGSSGVPPCIGSPGSPGTISQQPWVPSAG